MTRSDRTRSNALRPSTGGAAVRMYRQGLGDCFLLALDRGQARRPAFVLIDCGVHRSQPDGNANIRRIVDDVVRTTRGRLDVVVATHEQTDHLSGFLTESERLARGSLRIKHLWLGWTEDPDDPIARQLRRSHETSWRALRAAMGLLDQHVEHCSADGSKTLALQSTIREAALAEPNLTGIKLSLKEMAKELGVSGSEPFSGGRLAVRLLEKHARRVEYLRPGRFPLAIPGVSTARAYVLGPPEDLALLGKSRPSSDPGQETYLSGSAGLMSFASGALTPADGAGFESEFAGYELCQPFKEECGIPYEKACEWEFFRRNYGLRDPAHPSSWRQIESDWLFAAEQLALDHDSHTSNTSLVLAFELGEPGRGRVMLFAADARLQSWLSWAKLNWGPRGSAISAASLFARTVLYKVGRHASHTATLKQDREGRDYGLEQMPDGLVAMVPVDEGVASRLPGWRMPDPNLYRALAKKTRGNILRSDDDTDAAAPATRFTAVPGLPAMRWRSSSVTKVGSDHPLYYDVYLTADDSL